MRRNLLRWSAAIAVLLAAVEIGLRTVLGLGSPVLYVQDPHYGYFPKGEQHLHRFFVDIFTNHYGMRSADIALTKGAAEYRILFVGDSVPFGTALVDQKDIFVERIGAALAGIESKHVRVLNASAPGWAPSNELEYIRSRGLYGADLIVFVYNTKDLVQPFAAYEATPLYPLRNPSTAIGEFLSRYLLPRLLRSKPPVDPGSAEEGSPSMSEAARVLTTIDDTRQFVTSHGGRFAIIFTPVVTGDVRLHQREWDAALSNLRQWAARNEVPLLDMSQSFGAHDPAGIYLDGIHLQPAGDRLVADAFISRFAAELAAK